MTTDYLKFRNSIYSLNLSSDASFTVDIQSIQESEEIEPIKYLIDRESKYLYGINRLLTTIFSYLDKDVNNLFRTRIISKDQLIQLLGSFPIFYSLHLEFLNFLKEANSSPAMVGKVIYDFLIHQELFVTYENYVIRLPKILTICKIVESKSQEQGGLLKDLEEMITSPVEEFPRLYDSVKKLFKIVDVDKGNVYKAMSIIKSIIIRLEKEIQKRENMVLKDRGIISKKSGLSFSKIISNTQIFQLDTYFNSIKLVRKIPHYLILSDEDVILVPKEVPASDLSPKFLIKYPIKELQIRSHSISTFHKCSNVEGIKHCGKVNTTILSDRFKEIKTLYLTIADTSVDDPSLRRYEELLQDYCILTQALVSVQRLNFKWKDISETTIRLLLKDLETKLSEHEQNLNASMSSIVVMKLKSNNFSFDSKLILFQSASQSHEWKINFNRVKLLQEHQTDFVWMHCSAGFNFGCLKVQELPHIFQPIPLKTNMIKNVESVIITGKYVRMVSGRRFYSSLWICLANSWVIMLYHDYKQWNMLDSFSLDTNRPITVLCEVILLDCERTVIDSEIWIASGNQVIIYSLFIDHHPTINGRLYFPSDVNSICLISGKVWVGLNSHTIVIYSRNHRVAHWSRDEEEITDNSLEAMTDIIYDGNVTYVISERRILKFRDSIIPETVFQTPEKINTLSLTGFGLWIVFENDNLLYLYDKSLNGDILQTISLPDHLWELHSTGMVTCIYSNENFTWVGTENGFVICIAAVDSSYCVRSEIPIYFSSTFSTESITMLIPFRNMEPVNVEKHHEKIVNRFSESKQRDNLPALGTLQHSNSCPNIYHPDNITKSSRDSLCEGCLKNAYEQSISDSTSFVLAIGTGITILEKKVEKKNLKSTIKNVNGGQSSIFTFFE